MAGFFGFFDYTKEGPGIDKNAPKKKTFIVFFETFFRNMWKLISVNAVYIIMALLIIPIGLANVGLTNVTRNLARDKHSFMLSDFFETIKKNWKQGLTVGIINTVVFAFMAFALRFYSKADGKIGVFGLGVSIMGFLVFTVMNFYIYTLMITFNFTLKQLYVNSFKFVFLNLKNNVFCLFSLFLIFAVNYTVLSSLTAVQFQVLFIELFIAILTLPGFVFLIVQYATFPGIKKFIIDPYYKQHPGEDIEKRRNLGLEIHEETTDGEYNEIEDV